MSSNIKIINDIITQNSTLLKYLVNNSKFEFKFKKFKKFKTILIISNSSLLSLNKKPFSLLSTIEFIGVTSLVIHTTPWAMASNKTNPKPSE